MQVTYDKQSKTFTLTTNWLEADAIRNALYIAAHPADCLTVKQLIHRGDFDSTSVFEDAAAALDEHILEPHEEKA